MDSGDLCLATSKSSFISKCIRWFTKSKFSHSFVTMPDVLSVPMCIEASEGGVEVAKFNDNYLNNQDAALEVWTLNLDQDVKDTALQNTFNYLETSYGFLEYPWFMWRKMNSLFGRDIKAQNNWNTNGMICSQLCVTYLRACGLDDIFAGYGDGSIAPQDLEDIFKANPDLFSLKASYRL